MNKEEQKKLISDLKSDGEQADRALKSIYQSIFPGVKKMISSKSGSYDDAKDIFQEAMIAFLQLLKKDKFREESSISTVIHSIARNIWYTHLKKNNYTEDLSDYEDTNTKELIHLDTGFEWEEYSREKLVSKLIAELSADCQKIIRLFYYQKWSMEMISEEFDLSSEKAAKNKKYRCMQYLHEVFKQKSIKPSSI